MSFRENSAVWPARASGVAGDHFDRLLLVRLIYRSAFGRAARKSCEHEQQVAALSVARS